MGQQDVYDAMLRLGRPATAVEIVEEMGPRAPTLTQTRYLLNRLRAWGDIERSPGYNPEGCLVNYWRVVDDA